MDLDQVANALAERLDAIPGLRVSTEVPQVVNPPVAVIGLGAGTYETRQDLMTADFGVLILLSAGNVKGSQQALRAYCATTGDQSVIAALQTDAFELSLGGVDIGANVMVRGWDPPAIVTMGPTDYIGVEFHVQVIE